MAGRDTALHDALSSFRAWRRSRPFWAGLLTLAAALILLFPPYASLKFGDIVVSMNTIGGVSSLIIGIVMIICAASFWIAPHVRIAAGIVTLVLALISVVTSNLGTFLLGTLLGIVGGALALAWTPRPKRRPETDRGEDAG